MRSLIAAVAITLFASSVHAQQPSAKPNVLLIICDDLNTALGCYGHPVVKTPNVDRLAARGVRFDRAICQWPLCNPSRASILSGRRPDSTSVQSNKTNPREQMPEVVFLPQLFRRHGYFTAGVGKIFHGGMSDAACWDVMDEIKGYDDEAETKPKLGGKGLHRVFPVPTRNKDEHEPDGRIARRAVELLQKQGDRPFFIAVGFHAPHSPHVAPAKYFDMYTPDKLALPMTPPGDRDDLPSALKLRTPPNYADLKPEDARKVLTGYHGSTTFMDTQLGLILDALERLKLVDNTIVVFMSDHGYHLGEHGGLWGKGTLFLECARAPLVIGAPGKRAGTSPRTVEYVALYPTLAELCRLPTPKGLEAASFAALLDNPKAAWSRPAFMQTHQGRSVITERYRYTEYKGKPAQAELYDHVADPREFSNLAHHPETAKLQRELRALLGKGKRRSRN
jgi:iduronate 2-sulfatase